MTTGRCALNVSLWIVAFTVDYSINPDAFINMRMRSQALWNSGSRRHQMGEIKYWQADFRLDRCRVWLQQRTFEEERSYIRRLVDH